jgi:outer membrane receptor protein involved in Fe transport
MPKSLRYIAGITGFALALGGASSVAFAQEQDQDQEMRELEEVIVTASRREEALQDVALAVTVLDIEDFANAGKTNLSEILPFVPGVVLTNGGTSFGNGVIIRGINAFGAGGIGTYIDDIPYGSQTLYVSGQAPIDGTLLDLENLSVLKGPQGTLYGASAMGGLLKFKTRNASLDEWHGEVSADLSDTGRNGGLNQLYRVSANGPLSEGTVGLSFTGFWNDKTGYINNVVVPRDNWDDYEYYGGSASLLFVPNDKLTVKAQALYQRSTQDGAATVQMNGLDDFPIPGIPAGEPIYSRYEDGTSDINPSIYETSVFGLTIEYDFGFATLTSVTSYQELDFSQTADLTIPYAAFADLFFPENAPHTSALFVGALGFDKFTQEFRLTSESNKNFEWLAGAFYQNEDGYNEQDLIFTPPEPTFFYANFPSGYKEKALFATGTYYFTDNFDASIGLRYTDYKQNVELETRDTILVAPLPFNEISDDLFTYLGNLRYRAGENTSFYARVASGFRPGGANFVLIDPNTGQAITDPQFNADTLWSYELGVKGTTASGMFAYDLNAFYIDWTDYQIQVIRGGLSVAGNAEAASSKGAEAAFSFMPTDGFTISATASYTDAQIDTDEQDLGAQKGESIPGSPKWQGTVSANYDFNIGNVPAFIGGSWRYFGKHSAGYPGYTDTDGTFYPSSAPRLTVPSYTVLDARAGITTERFDVSVYATNLLNNDAWQSFGTSASAFSIGTPLRPRTIGVVLRAKF